MKISKKKLKQVIKTCLNEAMMPDASYMIGADEDFGDAYLPQEKVAPIPAQKGNLINSSKLASLDKKAIGPIRGFVDQLVRLGYRVRINSCWRSLKHQDKLFKKYKGKRDADVAPPGGSPHNYGLGVDINIYYDDKEGNEIKLGLDSSNEDWLKHIKNNAVSYEDYELAWGGNFKKRDAVHFDIYPIVVGEMKIRSGGYGSSSMWERDSLEKKLAKKAALKGMPLDSLYSKIVAV